MGVDNPEEEGIGKIDMSLGEKPIGFSLDGEPIYPAEETDAAVRARLKAQQDEEKWRKAISARFNKRKLADTRAQMRIADERVEFMNRRRRGRR